MTATISSWGNSQGLRFPKDIMKELQLSIGDKMKINMILRNWLKIFQAIIKLMKNLIII